MKKNLIIAIIVWNVFVILLSIGFATGKVSDMSWLVYTIATTFICTIIADQKEEEKKDYITEEEMLEAEEWDKNN